jgi:hypothetical protein
MQRFVPFYPLAATLISFFHNFLGPLNVAAMSLSVRELPRGPPNKSSAVRMCRLARIAAMIPMLAALLHDGEWYTFALCRLMSHSFLLFGRFR